MAVSEWINICQRTVGENTLPGYGPVILMKRPVRSRTQGIVGAGGEKPLATRLAIFIKPLVTIKLTLRQAPV